LTQWLPGFVLPNIDLKEPIDGEVIAIANCGDSRVQQMISKLPVFAEFVGRFSRPIGGSVSPSILIVRDDAPKSFQTVEAISSLRDLAAMCVIPLSRAKSARWERPHSTYYSNWYDFYPWTITANHQHVICNTPALRDLELVTDFNGQCDPGLSPVILEFAVLNLIYETFLRGGKKGS
jgi:hypothetical protein